MFLACGLLALFGLGLFVGVGVAGCLFVLVSFQCLFWLFVIAVKV